MRKTQFLRSLLLLLPVILPYGRAQAATDAADRKAETPRNIVFILSDDHRYDFMGFTGEVPWLETPNMDRMAQEGAHFPNAYVSTSLCSPSRATILTGMYAHQHKIVDNVAPDPGGLTYFPEYLQEAGYRTAFFGKWHMGDDDDRPRPGFDHWEGFRGQGVYYGVELNIDGKRVQYGDDVYTTDLLTEHAIDWMKQQQSEAPDRPFMIYLSHKAVHEPFEPAKRHEGVYAGKELPLPPTFEQTKTGEYRALGWPEWVAQQRISWHGVDYMYHKNKGMQELVTDYCETLLGVDDSIGSVLAYLEQAGLADSTLVVYMGDNGFSWGEHGLIDKRHFYEESAKVPLLMRCPELFEAGTTVKALVSNTDIAPTLLDVAGVEKPSQMVGASVVPVVQDPKAPWRDTIFYEYYWEYDFPMTPTVFGIRTGRYKYMRYWGVWDTNELYDLENDPDEMHNLIADPEYQDIVKDLAGQLFDWLERTNGMEIPLKPTIKYRWGDYRHKDQY